MTTVQPKAWSPEHKAEGSHGDEEEEERDEQAETSKAQEWHVASIRHSIAIIWIWLWDGFTRGRLNGDRRSFGNASIEGEEGNAGNGRDQHQGRYDSKYNFSVHFHSFVNGPMNGSIGLSCELSVK
jgi:hypothetical protein